MIRVCRECGEEDDEAAYDELCDFCAEVFNSDCHHMVKDLCASCDADLATADAFREQGQTKTPENSDAPKET